ncbi:MAG: chemotaxis protein CheW [Phycisphaerales bacterium]|jgi:chemotaxis-related protein WspB
MLAVVWEVGEERFTVDASQVVEVVPVVALHRAAGLPAWVLGLGDYHGRLIPILDAAKLVDVSPSPPSLGARVLVLAVEACGARRLVGLQVSAVQGVASIDPTDATGHRGFASTEAPHLGAVVRIGERTARRVVLDRFLAGSNGELLFGADERSDAERSAHVLREDPAA